MILEKHRWEVRYSADYLSSLVIGEIVSKNAISKYEKGIMMVDSKILLELARALDVKSDYFFRPFSVEIEKVEFRKKSKLSAKKVNAIREQVNDIVERYLEVEQFLSIPTKFKNPLRGRVIRTGEDVEEAVNQLLKQWEIGFNPIANIIELLEDKEIKVVEIEAPDEFDGFSGWADGKYPIIVVNRHYSIERKRLTALHELELVDHFFQLEYEFHTTSLILEE